MKFRRSCSLIGLNSEFGSCSEMKTGYRKPLLRCEHLKVQGWSGKDDTRRQDRTPEVTEPRERKLYKVRTKFVPKYLT